jgi:hypothetical protein
MEYMEKTMKRRLKEALVLFILTAAFTIMAVGSGLAVPAPVIETEKPHFSTMPENIRILPQITTDEVRKKIEDYSDSVSVLESDLSLQQDAGAKTATNDLQTDISHFKTLISIYQRILTALNKKTSLEKDLQLINEKKDQAEATISSQPPYSLGFYDSHMAALNVAEQRLQDIDISNRLTRSRLLDISKDIEENEKNIRLLKENQSAFITEPEKIFISWFPTAA